MKEGLGTIIFNKDEVYRGQFQNNSIHGNGIYYFSNGDKFIGIWKYGKRQGKGKYIFKNGQYYEGVWNDFLITEGVWYINESIQYSTKFKNNLPIDIGYFRFTNDNMLKGQYQ